MISTRGRYALRVMLDIAEQNNEGYTRLDDIAARQGISEKYLESILTVLTRADLLKGVRGKNGGYRLTKSPDEYTVGEILRLTETSLNAVACLKPNAAPCSRKDLCKTLPLWKGLDRVVNNYLDSITLSSLL